MFQLHILLIVLGLSTVTLSVALNFDSSIIDRFNSINEFNSTLLEHFENFKILEDAFLLTPELIKKYGYQATRHTVQTKDGYLLEMHRIPKPGAQPILLMHGLLDSSATWILMGPNKGLAYILADLGYDVWLGNARGNRYSKKHITLSPKRATFWDFSFHEIGIYDLPAMIDFVLQETKFDKLHYVGHSQGTCTFWIMCSERPEYNNKILSMQALGPVAFLSHMKSPLLQAIKDFTNQIGALVKLIGLNEFLPNSDFIAMFGQKFCKDGEFVQIICENFMFLLAGYNEKQTNLTMLPVIMGHIPAGSSAKQFIHFGQLGNSGYFRQYDHGLMKNLLKYHRISPPSYDLSKIITKVALYYSLNDLLAQPEDVERLYQQLPNQIGKFLVADQEFNHVDFLWGIDAKSLVYKKVIEIMKSVENDEI